MKRFELEDLAGWEVSGVCFVRDYVEFHFDGPILRCFGELAVVSGPVAHSHPSSGSHEALCSLINSTVTGATDLDEALVLELDDRRLLRIMKWSELAGPEIVNLVPFVDGRLDPSEMLIWENLKPTKS